jgi:inorganic pyrophosphatase/exopolyphosphatase
MQHIEDLASGKFDTVIVLITDIEKNGSYVFFDAKSKYILEEVFKNNNFQQGEYIQDLLSRKKQLVPFVLEILEK